MVATSVRPRARMPVSANRSMDRAFAGDTPPDHLARHRQQRAASRVVTQDGMQGVDRAGILIPEP